MKYQAAYYTEQHRISKLDWHIVRWGGIFFTLLFKVLSKPFRKTVYRNKLSRPIDKDETIIIAANHQRSLDPPGIFSALNLKDLYSFSPVKFLTWRRYYHSTAKPLLYVTGCYPTHGKGIHGISGSVFLADKGYTVFIFPEGKRTSQEESKPRDGITKVLNQVPDARLILVKVDWTERKRFYHRPELRVTFADAPKNLAHGNPNKIMSEIYKL